MDDKSVTLDPWAAIAAELHRIADDMLKLVGETAPTHVGLDILTYNPTHIGPDTAESRPVTMAVVDAVGIALVGKPGETRKMSDGTTYHYGVDVARGPIKVGIFQSIAAPDDEPEAGR